MNEWMIELSRGHAEYGSNLFSQSEYFYEQNSSDCIEVLFFYFQIQTYPIGYYGVRVSGGNISLDLLVAEQEERGWRTLQISAGQLSELESLFPVQELDIFSGWEGQNAITLCGSLS